MREPGAEAVVVEDVGAEARPYYFRAGRDGFGYLSAGRDRLSGAYHHSRRRLEGLVMYEDVGFDIREIARTA